MPPYLVAKCNTVALPRLLFDFLPIADSYHKDVERAALPCWQRSMLSMIQCFLWLLLLTTCLIYDRMYCRLAYFESLNPFGWSFERHRLIWYEHSHTRFKRQLAHTSLKWISLHLFSNINLTKILLFVSLQRTRRGGKVNRAAWQSSIRIWRGTVATSRAWKSLTGAPIRRRWLHEYEWKKVIDPILILFLIKLRSIRLSSFLPVSCIYSVICLKCIRRWWCWRRSLSVFIQDY